jgi:hypothetical protein
MLDDSGSMDGTPWAELMSAFRKFISFLDGNVNLK